MENGRCRLCGEFNETVEHLVAGCKTIANSEYLARHNGALMVMAIAWAKEYGLVGKETKWYMENWLRGQVLENSRAKLVWDFEFNLRGDQIWYWRTRKEIRSGYAIWHVRSRQI